MVGIGDGLFLAWFLVCSVPGKINITLEEAAMNEAEASSLLHWQANEFACRRCKRPLHLDTHLDALKVDNLNASLYPSTQTIFSSIG